MSDFDRDPTPLLEDGHLLVGKSPSLPDNAPLEGILISQIKALVSSELVSPATMTADGPMWVLVNTGAGGEAWNVGVASGNGRWIFTHGSGTPVKFAPDAISNLFLVGANATDRVTVGGDLEVTGAATLAEQVAEPPHPPDGVSVTWLSDGTGNGNAGDIMRKITQGAETRLFTVSLYSSGSIL